MGQSWEDLADGRRKNYAVTDADWIRSLLKRASHGVLATDSSGQPYAYPRLFVYDEGSAKESLGVIYIHGAKTGRTWENLHENPRVCFNVCEMGALLPSTQACGFNVNFNSAVVFGEMSVVEDNSLAEKALYLLIDKYFPDKKLGIDYTAITAEGLEPTAVYRLEIKSWSGKAHNKKL